MSEVLEADGPAVRIPLAALPAPMSKKATRAELARLRASRNTLEIYGEDGTNRIYRLHRGGFQRVTPTRPAVHPAARSERRPREHSRSRAATGSRRSSDDPSRPRPPRERQCARCSEPVTGRQKFCSNKCRQAAYRARERRDDLIERERLAVEAIRDGAEPELALCVLIAALGRTA